MKARFLFLIISCTATGAFGQAYIKGRIKDRQQNLSSATVLLLTSDSTLIKRVIADHMGEFIFGNVMPGHYLVSSSAVGHSSFLSPPVPVAEKNVILPDIVLEVSATGLDEVVVKAKKPLFEQQIDRLVVNVQRSITSSGKLTYTRNFGSHTLRSVKLKSGSEEGRRRIAN